MISKHISDKEGVYSTKATRRGLDNNPSQFELANMKELAEQIFEPLREWVGGAIRINSFYYNIYFSISVCGSTNDNLLNERIYDNTGKFYGVCTTVSSTISIIFADGLYNSFVDNELLYVGKRTHILKSVKIPNGASLELDGFSVNNRTHKMYVRSADANGEIDVVIKT